MRTCCASVARHSRSWRSSRSWPVSARPWRRRATPLATTSSPTTRPPRDCWTANRCTTCRSLRPVASGSSTTRRRSRRSSCRSVCCRQRPPPGPGSPGCSWPSSSGSGVLPVSRSVRWWIVLLAGWSFPFVYAVKLGQVGPILFLTFAIGWRWIDDPIRLGASGAVGAAIKLQPGLILVWALLTRRFRAVVVGGVVLLGAGGRRDRARRHVRLDRLPDAAADGQRPDHHRPQLHARRGRLPAGGLGGHRRARPARQHRRGRGVFLAAIRWSTPEASYLVAVIASQLVSPIVWDHYAMLLLLPVAYLLSAGRWWALAIPLVTAWPLVDVTPPVVYPVVFWVTLVATFLVGRAASTTAPAPVCGEARRRVNARMDRATLVGFGVVAVSPVLYWLANRVSMPIAATSSISPMRSCTAGRGWTSSLGPWDVIRWTAASTCRSRRSRPSRSCRSSRSSGRCGPTSWNPGSTPLLAAGGVGMCWWLLGRIGVSATDRPRLAGRPVRVLDADPVGDDPRRRVAHRATSSRRS